MTHTVVDKFTHQSAMQLHRTLYLMDKQAERILQEKHKLTLSQFFVLAQMVRGRQCQRELAESLGITPAAISRHVSVLEREGLLERLQHDGDKRFGFLRVSKRGEQEFAAAARDLDAFFESRYRSLDRAQKQQILESLNSLMGCYDGQCE